MALMHPAIIVWKVRSSGVPLTQKSQTEALMSTLHHRIRIAAPSHKVFDAISSRKGLQGWWTPDVANDPSLGTTLRFGFFNRSVVFLMRVDEVIPGRRIAWSCLGKSQDWVGTKLVWDIQPVAKETELSFRHTNWRTVQESFAESNTTWGALMHQIKEYAERNPAIPRPFFTH